MAKERKDKKDGVRTHFYLERDISESLDDFCERTARTKTRVVELALKDYLEKHKDEE